MSWTDERVELLKTLRARAESASEIAAKLTMLPPYSVVTRNAVIGKAVRLGLESKLTAANGVRRARRKRHGPLRPPRSEAVRRPPKSVLTTEPLPLPREDDIGRIHITMITDDQCKFIPGDGPGGMCCGLDAVPGTSWCGGHLARVFAAPAPAPKRHANPIPAEREKERV